VLVGFSLDKHETNLKHNVFCRALHLNKLSDHGNTEIIEEHVKNKYFRKIPVGKEEAARLTEESMPTAAFFSYIELKSSESHRTTQASSSTYEAAKDLDKMSPEEAQKLRQSFWTKVDKRMFETGVVVVPQGLLTQVLCLIGNKPWCSVCPNILFSIFQASKNKRF
jgi:hypothetical protein